MSTKKYVLYCTQGQYSMFVSGQWTRGNISIEELQAQVNRACRDAYGDDYDNVYDFSSVILFLIVEADRPMNLSCLTDVNCQIPKHAIAFYDIKDVKAWIGVEG